MIKDYNEIICKAVDIIVQQRLSELKFDETIICEIIDDSKQEEGVYEVLYNDTLRFTAYAEENKKYRTGNKVYILVPQGDYSQDKIIQGRYSSSKTIEPISYSSPLSKIQPIKTLIKYNSPLSLMANGEEDFKDFSILKPDEGLNNLNDLKLKDAKYICLKVDTKCLLNKYNVKKGSYGIKIVLNTNLGVYEYFLDSINDMFGDPYSYISYFPQEQVYQLNFTEEETLQGFGIQFYQNSDFEYYDGIHSYFQKVPIDIVNNIFIKNVHIYFGRDLIEGEIQEETIELNKKTQENYQIWNEFTEVFDENQKYIIDGAIAKRLFNLLQKEQKEE